MFPRPFVRPYARGILSKFRKFAYFQCMAPNSDPMKGLNVLIDTYMYCLDIRLRFQPVYKRSLPFVCLYEPKIRVEPLKTGQGLHCSDYNTYNNPNLFLYFIT